jgi:hypothetical protein
LKDLEALGAQEIQEDEEKQWQIAQTSLSPNNYGKI